jgi:hypothetical protein
MLTNSQLAVKALNDTVRRIRNRVSVPVPVSAPLPSVPGETVGQYNSRHYGRAWQIIAMTWDGAAYCADCAYDWPTWEYDHDWVECPVPVFASDELYGDPCDACLEALA